MVRVRSTALAFLALIALSSASAGAAQERSTPAPATAQSSLNDRLTGDITPVHDPAIIRAGDTFYLFSTSQQKDGKGLIHIRTSKDLVNWTFAGAVFRDLPAWARKAIPKAGGIWAPDVSYENGRYRLYYAVSTFGSNRSVIGLATNTTLDPSSPAYAWRDEGEVVSSNKWNDFNAIDPNLVLDRDNRQWLAFGSFWSGIKLIRIDPATGKRSADDKTVHAIAERAKRDNWGAIEASFIIDRGGFYYLFASFDLCCRGTDSTYYTVVGRSKEITGPYVDRDGRKMMDGGGFVVLHASLDPTKRWRGPGHPAILREPSGDYIVYHAYDAEKKGASTLRIQPLGWTEDGWPVAL